MNLEKNIEIIKYSPEECPEKECLVFKKLVKKGGEVTESTLPNLIKKALSLAFAKKNGNTVGIGAIKKPEIGYRSSIFEKAKIEEEKENYEFELGWIYVEKDFHGKNIAKDLVSKLIESLNGSSVYATTTVGNEPMRKILKNNSFKEAGSPFPSRLKKDIDIQLFLREK